MYNNLLPLILVLLIAAQQAPSFAQEQQNHSQEELPTVDHVKNQIESIMPAVVQVSYDGFHYGCGVIVSSEGHIVFCGPVGAVLDNRILELRTTDGRLLRGEALGWSGEFGAGLLKIAEPGEWKFVKLSNEVSSGELCLGVGYPRNHNGEANSPPQIRLGLVTQVYESQWFDTSYQSDFGGHPVFNMRGELLGLQTKSDGEYSTFSHTKPIRAHWNELVSGLNLDRKRLLEETGPPQNIAELPENIGDVAIAKAKAATVQIGDMGKKPVFSGIIVPDGYVVTCAHHGRLPGDSLEITLADGRSAYATVRGTNRLTDISLLKINDLGEWPFVDLGYSSMLTPGNSVVVIGYPIKNEGIPLVLKSLPVIEKPDGGLKRRDSFSCSLFLECNDEEVVTNLRGASGGGVFDSLGNLVGVLSSSNAGWSPERVFHGEIWNARAELIHKNWENLVDGPVVTFVDKQMLETALPGLEKLMAELEISGPQN